MCSGGLPHLFWHPGIQFEPGVLLPSACVESWGGLQSAWKIQVARWNAGERWCDLCDLGDSEPTALFVVCFILYCFISILFLASIMPFKTSQHFPISKAVFWFGFLQFDLISVSCPSPPVREQNANYFAFFPQWGANLVVPSNAAMHISCIFHMHFCFIPVLCFEPSTWYRAIIAILCCCTFFYKYPCVGWVEAVPDRASAVLRITPEGAHLVGGPLVGHFKWHLGPNGQIQMPNWTISNFHPFPLWSLNQFLYVFVTWH